MDFTDSRMQPSTAFAPPEIPERAPCGTTGMPWAWAKRIVVTTSSTECARTRASGVPSGE